MLLDIQTPLLAVLLLPLVASVIAGVFGHVIGRYNAHRLTITAMVIAFLLTLYLAHSVFVGAGQSVHVTFYTWVSSGHFHFDVSVMLDRLSAIMLVMVSFVSLLVHIYSVGYMRTDDSYQRFFSYLSLFTFFMFMLVLADNFVLLFFGWEGVGLVSYLLIGFWHQRESAAAGSMKAFIVNRVGDFGFILAISAMLTYFGSLDYHTVFAKAAVMAQRGDMLMVMGHWPVSVLGTVTFLLFVGAMGKSAQVPLHIWLPESMEGPTPISALIHAATMVTAGVYLLARISPMLQFTPQILSIILIIGATGALFLGLVGLVQTDIKRVVAYSTLSQLGYMIAAEGASAYSVGIFHLLTHACFKALLFLGAGSVIVALHHEQDLRKMGGLARRMPVTYLTFLLGALSLSAIPPFAGFYSKDAIIEAVHASAIAGSHYAYWCVLLGSFVTALYTFRCFFMAFHGNFRGAETLHDTVTETAYSIRVPLMILAIPSVLLGACLIEPMLFAPKALLDSSVIMNTPWDGLSEMRQHFSGVWAMAYQAVTHLPLYFALAGVGVAWLAYVKYPAWPERLRSRFAKIHHVLQNGYGFDKFNERVFIRGVCGLGAVFYRVTDKRWIDDGFVNGSGRLVIGVSAWARRLQTGYLYHYAFAMMLGLLGFLCWFILVK